MFSDGIPEAQRGDEFFDDERITVALEKLLARRPSCRPRPTGLIAEIDAFAAGEHRADDVTLVMLRRD